MQIKYSILCGAMVFAHTQLAEAKPNVILIYADDMGKGMLSAYGQDIISTPNIDKLINNGVQFTHAYGGHYSAPARASLLTGYSDVNSSHWSKSKGKQFCVADTAKIATIERELNANDVRLPEGDLYLPEVFNKAGYVTGQIGKLEYGFLTSRQQMRSHGWQYFYGFLDHGRCHGFFPPFLFENEKIVMIEGNTHPDCAVVGGEYYTEQAHQKRWDMEGKLQYSQDLFNDKIIEFVRTNRKNPFFLYHPTQLPHGPVSVKEIDPRVKNLPSLNSLEKEYATMMLLLDDAVGLILKELDSLGIADNTMIVFSSDNGHEIYYETNLTTTKDRDADTGRAIDDYYIRYNSHTVNDIFNGNMGMSGKKRSNLNGGILVPLSYYMPSKLSAGVCDDVVSNYDFIATMADMLGVKLSQNKDSRSYLSALSNPSHGLPSDRYVVADSQQGPTIIRNDGWKLRYSDVIDDYELFNIRRDYTESFDLSKKYPEIAQELRDILRSKVEVSVCNGGYADLTTKMK